MAKAKTVYFCQNCGYESPKWLGKCPSCGEWNQFAEETVVTGKKSGAPEMSFAVKGVPVPITEIEADQSKRKSLQDEEVNRVLGGGLVPGSLVLLAGEPGIGKSTLLLQTAMIYPEGRILYVSGEESQAQIASRAERIGKLNPNCFLLSETDPDTVIKQAEKLNPDFIIVDSVQTLDAPWIESSPGSVSQIRESAARLMRYAKSSQTAVFLIGHITKEGSIAGPKVLEHMVDAVIVFEGDQRNMFRLLRCTKNRFGSTNELGIYQMEGSGLRPVANPSELLMSGYSKNMSGSAAAAIIEGIRPLIIEVQALVSSAVYGTPQRSATGFDVRRLHMLLAVLEKRCGFRLGAKDVFLNLAGGLKVNDPSIDLAVVAAILSSGEDLTLPEKSCFAGEVGLSGEIRPVSRIDQRISEASKMGFSRIFISAHHPANTKGKEIEIVRVGTIREMLTEMFG